MTGIQVLVLKLQTAEINFDIRTRLAKSNYHKTK